MPPTPNSTLIEPAAADDLKYICDIRPKDDELEELIQELRQRVKDTKFPGSITPRLDSDFLAKFIRVKDYNIDKAYTAIQKYYACIHANFNFFKGIRPSDFSTAIRYEGVSLAKKHNRPNGVGLLIIKAKYWNPKQIQVRDFQLGFIHVAEEYLRQPELQENGISVIADLEGLRFDQVWSVSVREMWRTARIALHGMPVRVKEGHVLNIPSIFWPAYRVGKRFLTDKIVKRVHFHENLESLYEYIGKDKLPQSLGGYLDDEDAHETCVINRVLKNDVPFEHYWNGKYWNSEDEENQ